MIGTMAWKEYREHRTIWLVMATLAVGLMWLLPEVLLLVGLPVAGRNRELGPLHLAALGAVVTYGVVCGSMLLAGEREGNTLTFLESLSGRRWPLWRAKVLAGVVLVLLHGLVAGGALATVLLTLGEGSGPVRPTGWLVVLPLVALDAFVWGLVASALSRSVLAAAGLATVFLVVTWFVAFMGSNLIPAGFLTARAVFAVLGLVGSAWVFCRADFRTATSFTAPLARLPEARRIAPRPRLAPAGGLRAVAWLTLCQGRILILVLALAAIPTGMFLPAVGPLLWLNLTLLVGVLCGTAVFGWEQSDGANRFLGDQRLPLGRVWAVKSALWGAAAVGVAVLILLGCGLAVFVAYLQNPSSIRGIQPHNAFLESLLVGRPSSVTFLKWGVPAGTGLVFLPLGLIYGFALGQFYSLVWRKSVVAVFVALAASAGAVALWLPSIPWGGLSLWHLLVPPALLLAAVRLVLWPWAGSSLAARKPVLTLTAGGVLSVAWVVGALGWRAVEMPNVGEPFDTAAYVAALPLPENNETSRIVRPVARAARERQQRVDLRRRPPRAAQWGMGMVPDGDSGFLGQLTRAQETGWPENDRDLGPWLDDMFAASWPQELEPLRKAPLGTIEDPRSSADSPRRALDQDILLMAILLEVRALQLQARSRHAEALDQLTLLLTLARHLRHKTTSRFWMAGMSAEMMGLRGLNRWLSKVEPRPDLLTRALKELDRHEAEAAPASDCIKAEYVRALARTETPDALVRTLRRGPVEMGPPGEEELANAAWQLPWEKERRRRLLNAVFAAGVNVTEADPWTARRTDQGPPAELHRDQFGEIGWAHGLGDPEGPTADWSARAWGRKLYDSGLSMLVGPPARELLRQQTQSQCMVRAARLQMALALYQARHGRPAASLSALVPDYLAKVPTDPFSGQPFGYRIARRGENVPELGSDKPRQVPPGSGILWSTGPDGIDHGGLRQWGSGSSSGQPAPPEGRDVLFVVPVWPKEGGADRRM